MTTKHPLRTSVLTGFSVFFFLNKNKTIYFLNPSTSGQNSYFVYARLTTLLDLAPLTSLIVSGKSGVTSD